MPVKRDRTEKPEKAEKANPVHQSAPPPRAEPESESESEEEEEEEEDEEEEEEEEEELPIKGATSPTAPPEGFDPYSASSPPPYTFPDVTNPRRSSFEGFEGSDDEGTVGNIVHG